MITILAGIDEEFGPQISKIDPAGFYGIQSYCRRTKRTMGNHFIRKKLEKGKWKLYKTKPLKQFLKLSKRYSQKKLMKQILRLQLPQQKKEPLEKLKYEKLKNS